MLLLTVLIAVAVTAGLIAALVARWCQRLLHGVPATEAAAPAVAHAAGPGHDRAWWRARLHPGEATGLLLTMGAAIVIAGGVVIGVLAYLVRGNDTLRSIDTSAADWGARHATDGGTAVLQRLTDLGDTRAVVVLAVVVAAIELWRAPSRFIIPFLVAVTLGNWLVTTAIKDLADRARPTLNPIAETLGPSFPSGHSSTAAAFFAAAALLLGRRRSPQVRAVLAGIAVGVAVMVAGTRVLLDVHWLSDTMAGVALGWSWFTLCAIAFGGRLLQFGAVVEDAADEAVATGAESTPPRPGSGFGRPRAT
jgi:undecaprenyl-diphosphatase